jgi:hypothetical protein
MHTSTLQQLKQAIRKLPPAELEVLLLQVAKFKTANKALLHYLLFEQQDEEAYIEKVKAMISEALEATNTHQVYLAKKTIRKALRIADTHIRYAGKATTCIEILCHFCVCLESLPIGFEKYPILLNMYHRQLKKIDQAIQKLHEDLQYDYQQMLMKTLKHYPA